MPAATDMQQMEMDMVEGMYENYELLCDDPPTYAVSLAASADDPPELKVTVCYQTDEYPEEGACTVSIDNISKHRRIQTAHITKVVTATCDDNIGTHVVILALQQIQAFLSDFAEEAERAELVRRGAAQEAAADKAHGVTIDPTVKVGTAVTKELFAEWSRRRLGEKAKLRTEKEKALQRQLASKLTGRQLWDSTLRSADWELFGGGGGGDDEGEDVDFDGIAELDSDDFDLGAEDDEEA